MRRFGPDYRARYPVTCQQHRVMSAITSCRTSALGGHVEICDRCGETKVSYNSCRNRHCPKCQTLTKARWLEKRRADLLPVEYFHVVFTVPRTVARLAVQNRRVVYDTLFAAASATLRTIAADPKHLGAEIGFIALLHTWGQNLEHHPHLHCVVTGGGIDHDRKRWIACRPGFFLPVKVLSRLFRRLFVEALAEAFESGILAFGGSIEPWREPKAFSRLLDDLRAVEWVVYAKPPFGGPERVLDYLGRYTHRVAIANHRIEAIDRTGVTFRWRDYRCDSAVKTMTLEGVEFLRRFLLHTLPLGFVRIRHYGFLANRHRAARIDQVRAMLDAEPPPAADDQMEWQDLLQRLTGRDPTVCSSCKKGTVVVASRLPAQPPVRIDSS